jgi:transcriptional regulator with XRE-family HTH domain
VTAPAPAVGPLAETLRAARKGRGLSIAELAVLAEVSPRLISELERGKRAHVSFETAMRLVQLVGVTVTFDARPARADEAARRRAEQRRKYWTGEQSTQSMQAPPQASSDAVARLTAVATASRLVAGLQRAYRAETVTPRSPKSAE